MLDELETHTNIKQYFNRKEATIKYTMIKLPFSKYTDLGPTIQKGLDKHLVAQTKMYFQEIVNLVYGACFFGKYHDPYEAEKFLCKFMPKAMMEDCTFYFLEHFATVDDLLPNETFLQTLIHEDILQEENVYEHLTTFLTALEGMYSSFVSTRDTTYDFSKMDAIYKRYMQYLGNYLQVNLGDYEHFLIITRGDEFARYFPH